ncbi:hypothetical protein HGI30_07960 [Paenibacillus albicereus]|uniref:SHOCT domain-containing protein n=1 Tax=Paenibacillus albicereus TaxID=2726185 RepID=A0A6H2GWH4_9BACL|nr:PH domain-containing protein [Paenibacillus albicereus]QJC51488.1 hypothetical protein HGI30_07960 [Paenibacillus albicereus]
MASFNKQIEHGKKHLKPGEKVLGAVMGAYEGKSMGKSVVKVGIFLATNERVFFFAKRMFGFDSESFPYSNISSFEYSKGLSGYSLSFYASNNKVKMNWINKGEVTTFINEVNSRVGVKQPSGEPIFKQEDAADQIRKLSDLLKDGIISEDEFAAKKKQLLGV